MKYSLSILEYLGKLANGVLVLISIIYNGKYYECTFFYNGEDMVLTASSELENEMGHPIVEDVDYVNMLKDILKKVVPFSEIYNRLDYIDLKRWENYLENK